MGTPDQHPALLGTLASSTGTWTLDQLIARLAAQPVVDGVLLMGSTAMTPTPDSDYDLLLVVNELPAPVHLVVATVDDRFAEMYVQTTAQIDDLMNSVQPISTHSFDGALATWFQTGRIAFDRAKRLGHAQERLQLDPRLVPPGDGEIYRTWFRINYNVVQTRRMLHAADPWYHQAVDFRLLYALPEVVIGYLKMRGLPWHGEKWALRFLHTNDPQFLRLFQRCIVTLDRADKFALYEQMAAHALEPIGGMWPAGATVVDFSNDADAQPPNVDAALRWWEWLLDV
jgi:hypothetical protein